MKIYEGFKDIWRNGFYTLSTSEGYFTFPTKEDARVFLKEIKSDFILL